MMKNIAIIICFFPLVIFGQAGVKPTVDLSKIMLPKGYRIEVYAGNVPGAREMDMAEDGTLFVGSAAGKVYAVKPDRTVVVIADSLDSPAGVDYYNGDLYVAEISRVTRYESILKNLETNPKPAVINANFPKGTYNGLKFIRIGPDGKLYIPVGSSCNVCMPDSTWSARILRMTLDGGTLEYFAEGVRNCEGFDWSPDMGSFWFTDISREGLGEDKPADELNKSRVAGEHFGFPFVNGDMLDPVFWAQRVKNKSFTSPAWKMPAHCEPAGMRFYTGKMFDMKYQGGVFVAEQGSPNQANKTGFRVSYITINEDRAINYEVFAGGWLQGETAWGRPADVQVGLDGSLFVSDDLTGCVYRIWK
jgi:glucose/arabinose dehydrogenase